MYAMIGISSMLLVLWGIFSIVKCNIQKTSFIESVIDKVYRDAEAARRATLDAGVILL